MRPRDLSSCEDVSTTAASSSASFRHTGLRRGIKMAAQQVALAALHRVVAFRRRGRASTLQDNRSCRRTSPLTRSSRPSATTRRLGHRTASSAASFRHTGLRRGMQMPAQEVALAALHRVLAVRRRGRASTRQGPGHHRCRHRCRHRPASTAPCPTPRPRLPSPPPTPCCPRPPPRGPRPVRTVPARGPCRGRAGRAALLGNPDRGIPQTSLCLPRRPANAARVKTRLHSGKRLRSRATQRLSKSQSLPQTCSKYQAAWTWKTSSRPSTRIIATSSQSRSPDP